MSKEGDRDRDNGTNVTSLADLLARTSVSDDEAIELVVVAAEDATYAGRPDVALSLIRQLRESFDISNVDPRRLAWLVNIESVALHRTGQQAEAVAGLHRMKAIGEDLDDPDITSTALQNLGMLAHEVEDYERARGFYRQSLRLKSQIGDHYGAIQVVLNVASIMVSEDDLDGAENLLNDFQPLARSLQDPPLLASYQSRLGVISAQRGHYQEAEGHLRRALRNVRRGNRPGLEITLMQNLGKLFTDQELPSRALRWYHYALKKLEDLKEPSLEVLLRRSRALALREAGREDDAMAELIVASNIAEEIDDQRNLALTTAELGELLASREDLDRAVGYFDRAAEAFREVGDELHQARCLVLLASATIRLGDPKGESVELVERAIRLLPPEAHAERARALRMVAEAWFGARNKVDRIAQYYARSLDEARNAEDLSTLAWLTVTAAAGVAGSGGAAESLAYFTRAIGLYEQLDDSHMAFHTRNDRAIQLAQLGRLEEAREDQQTCLEIAHRLQDRVLELQALLNSGETERRAGNIPEGVIRARRALDLARVLADTDSEAEALGNLGIALSDQEQWDDAEQVFRSLRELARDNGNRAAEATAVGGLARVEFVRGHYGRAAQFYGRAAKLTANEPERGRQRVEDLAGVVQSLSARGGRPEDLQEPAQMLVDLSQEIGETELASASLANGARWWLERDEQEEAASLYAIAIVLAGTGPTYEQERSTDTILHDIGLILAQIVYQVRDTRPDFEDEFFEEVLTRLNEDYEVVGGDISELLTSIQEAMEAPDWS